MTYHKIIGKMFPHMYEIDYEIRKKVVHYYLENHSTLEAAALKFSVHPNSVYKWVKWYKSGGEERLMSRYKRPWNRTDEVLEQKVVSLKEHDPTLTIRRAKKTLNMLGIEISLKGIWGIWQRYGYAGFNKNNLSNDYTKHCPWTRESFKKFRQARALFNLGQMNRSAEILNSIPVLPSNDLVCQIPDSNLNLKRRIERTVRLFGKVSLPSYLKQINVLYKECQEHRLYYTALRVGIAELIALSWHLDPETQLNRTHTLLQYIKRRGQYYSNLLLAPKLTLLISAGITYGDSSRIKEAKRIAQNCRRMIKRRKQIPRNFMINLGALYTQFENYQEAAYWFQLALSKTIDEKEKKELRSRLAGIYYINGEYKRAIQTLKHASLHEWFDRPKELFFRAMWCLMKGQPNRSIAYSTKALALSRKEDLNLGIVKANLAIANAYCSLGEIMKAKKILDRLIEFTKIKWRRAEEALEILIASSSRISALGISSNQSPSTIIALFLRKGQYKKAYEYAKKNGLMAYFHRFVFFAPEGVLHLLNKGENTRLPRAVLRLPVFNKNAPYYNIKFLGDLIVVKNHRRLRVRLRPKEKALLIHCALRMAQPGSKIPLDMLYRNFWRHSKQPARNLSAALVSIRRALKMPLHLMEISWKIDNAVLVNKGVHFITDYDEFKQKLVQADAFLRVDEWDFAKREFSQAFRFVRSAPFVKMYDNWSEDVRRVILKEIEQEANRYMMICKEHGESDRIGKTRKEIIKKISNNIPI